MHHATDPIDLSCSETLVEHDDLNPDARLDTPGNNVFHDCAAAWRWHAHGTEPTAERGPLEGGTNTRSAKGRAGLRMRASTAERGPLKGGTDASFAKWRGGQRMRAFLPFEAARTIVRRCKLRSRQEWRTWSKSEQRPDNVPGSPHVMYKDAGWISVQDWLGYSSVRRTASRTVSRTASRIASRAASRNSMVPFAVAREFVWTLKLKSRREWRAWCKAGNRPNNIPAAPRDTYRNKGWISTSDWLGYNSKKKRRGMPRRPQVGRRSSPTCPPDVAPPATPTLSRIASVWPGDTPPGFTVGHQHESIAACGAGEYDWGTGAAELAEGNGDHNVCAMDSHWRNVELEMDSNRQDPVLAEFTLALSETMEDISS